MSDEPILVPFGPTRGVPEGHRWCFACDGSGEDSLEDDKSCEVCGGKGHWNVEDIRKYHQRHPHICRKSCGERHMDPYFGLPPLDHAEIDQLRASVRELLGLGEEE